MTGLFTVYAVFFGVTAVAFTSRYIAARPFIWGRLTLDPRWHLAWAAQGYVGCLGFVALAVVKS